MTNAHETARRIRNLIHRNVDNMHDGQSDTATFRARNLRLYQIAERDEAVRRALQDEVRRGLPLVAMSGSNA